MQRASRRCLWRTIGSPLTRLIMLVGAVTGCAAHSVAPNTTTAVPAVDRPGTTYFAAAERQHVPSLSGSTLNGTALSVDRLLGHDVVVVNVWAAWCTECRAESTALAELSRELTAHGVTFVGIDEQDNPVAARAFVASVGSTYPSIVDPDGRVLGSLVLLPNSGIPSTLVIDRHGLMAGRIIGTATFASLQSLIARVAADG